MENKKQSLSNNDKKEKDLIKPFTINAENIEDDSKQKLTQEEGEHFIEELNLNSKAEHDETDLYNEVYGNSYAINDDLEESITIAGKQNIVQQIKSKKNNLRLCNDIKGVQIHTDNKYNSSLHIKDFQNDKNNGFYKIGSKIGVITSDYIIEDGKVIPKMSNSKYKLAYAPNINEAEAFAHVIKMTTIADEKHTIPVLIYVIMSIMYKLFAVCNFKQRFVLWIYASTGSFKSEITKLFSFIYNTDSNFDEEDYSSTIDTVSSIDLQYKDMGMGILAADDFNSTESRIDMAKMLQMRSKIIRELGERKGKNRSNILKGSDSLSAMKTYKPEVGIVATAEDLPISESDRARLLIVNFNDISVNTDVLTYCQYNRIIYSTAIHHFLKWITEKGDAIFDIIVSNGILYRQKYSKTFLHPRYPDTFVMMLLAIDIFFKYASDKKVSNELHLSNLSQRYASIIYNTVIANSDDILYQKPAYLFLNAIKELIDSKEERVLPVDYSGINNQKIIGYEDEFHYYIPLSTAMNSVVKFYNRCGRGFPFTDSKTLDDLERLGVIVVTYEGNKRTRTPKRTFNSIKNKRYLILIKDRIETVLYR